MTKGSQGLTLEVSQTNVVQHQSGHTLPIIYKRVFKKMFGFFRRFLYFRERQRQSMSGRGRGKRKRISSRLCAEHGAQCGARSKILRLRSEPKPRVGHPGAPKRCLFLTKISLSHQENNYIHYVKLRQEVC